MTSRARVLDSLRREAEERLAIQTEVLTGLFEKYRLVPALVARRRDVADLFAAPEQASRDVEAAAMALEVQGLSGAPHVLFVNSTGAVFAHAAPHRPAPAVPASLFEAARQHRLGRASVTDSAGERAYLFSSGVWQGDRLLGLVAVAVPLDSLEATWSLSRNPIFVTDELGRILISNVPDWRLQPGRGATAVLPAHDLDEVFLASPDGREHPFVEASRDLPLLGWTLSVLVDVAPARLTFWIGGGAAALVLGLVALVALFILMRRDALLRRMRSERAATLRLERRVRDRTRELAREVEERAEAERNLRAAQEKVVQSAKLAAIGQMATTLSHEFNQPLTAIQAFADNAKRFLERGNSEAATRNLGKIEEMIRRTGELSRTLLSFARPPDQSVTSVPLAVVVDEALIMMRPRARTLAIALEIERPEKAVAVQGGRIRLTQVVVNLLANAIDAVSEEKDGRVRIAWGEDEEGAFLFVEDNGPGVSPEMRQTIFDPFFTTKGVGKGFGIGLSIVASIVAEFGGSIAVGEGREGGARFEVRLKGGGATLPTESMTVKVAS